MAEAAAAYRGKEITPTSINQCIPFLQSCSEKCIICSKHSASKLGTPFTAHGDGSKEHRLFFSSDMATELKCINMENQDID